MEAFLNGRPLHERWFFKLASKGIYPTILSAIGYAYITIPSHLQETVRRVLPLEVKSLMLMLFTAEIWIIVLLIVTVIFSIWGGCGSHIIARLVKAEYRKVTEDYSRLKLEHDSKSINCYRLFSNFLYGYYQRFEFTANERVSLYKLDMDMFSCIGRHSDDEVFKSKPSRLYPQEEGCISKAWKIGAVEDSVAPDPKESLIDWEEYHIEKFNLPRDILENIKMKSRSFYGFRLRNKQNEAIAVIMFESLDPGGLNFGKLNRYFTDIEKRKIAHLVESLESHIPSLEAARSEGF